MKTIHRCVYMKRNVVYGRNMYFYELISRTSPDLPFVIEFVYVFPLVKRHNISITRGRSTGVPYQRMKKPIILYKIKDLYSSTI
jgi:hypothetical protein